MDFGSTVHAQENADYKSWLKKAHAQALDASHSQK